MNDVVPAICIMTSTNAVLMWLRTKAKAVSGILSTSTPQPTSCQLSKINNNIYSNSPTRHYQIPLAGVIIKFGMYSNMYTYAMTCRRAHIVDDLQSYAGQESSQHQTAPCGQDELSSTYNNGLRTY